MENGKEKKIFSPEIRPKCLGMEKRWFIEYYRPLHNGHSTERVRVYGKLNYKRTFEERMAEALRLMAEIRTEKKNIIQAALDNKTGIRKHTRQTFQNHLNNFFRWWTKDPVLLTEADAEKYLGYLYSEGYAKKTVHANRGTLYMLYKACKKKKEVAENPFEEVKAPKVRGKSKMYFTAGQRGQLKAWMSKHDPQLWLSCQLLYYAFIRPEEQRFTKVGDIYLDQGVIEVRGEVAKNAKTERVVVPKQLRIVLRYYVRNYTPEMFLFTNQLKPGMHPVGHNYFNYRHRKALAACGITGNYSHYSWKHSGAKELHDARFPIKYIQMQLRHSSLEETDEYLKNLSLGDWEPLQEEFPEA